MMDESNVSQDILAYVSPDRKMASFRNLKLTRLPDSLWNLTSLTTLDLSGNVLAKLPDSLGNLTSLTTLDLSDNVLAKLPDSLGNLTSLTTLDLSDNVLAKLPDCKHSDPRYVRTERGAGWLRVPIRLLRSAVM